MQTVLSRIWTRITITPQALFLNARPHSARITLDLGWSVLTHLPQSPDIATKLSLSPSFLFLNEKKYFLLKIKWKCYWNTSWAKIQLNYIYISHQVVLIAWIPLNVLLWGSVLVGTLDGTHCPHRGDEYKYVLVGQPWCVHIQEYCPSSMSCSSYLDGL